MSRAFVVVASSLATLGLRFHFYGIIAWRQVFKEAVDHSFISKCSSYVIFKHK